MNDRRKNPVVKMQTVGGDDAARRSAANDTGVDMEAGKDSPGAASGRDNRHDDLNHATQAWLSRYTHGLSPAALMDAWFDWYVHIVAAPGKRLKLAEQATATAARQARFALDRMTMTAPDEGEPAEGGAAPLPQDRRFSDDAWQKRPFDMIHRGFLLQQQWWHDVVTDVPGVTAQHERQLQFMTRQMLDMMSPSNFPFTNPEVLRQTLATGGQNLRRGTQHLRDDIKRSVTGTPPAGVENFQPGQDVAVTKGKIVYRNRLIELIQYAPTTGKVRPEPILIVPAWIMKYYILDLSPHNSMVRHLVGQGYTVFMISWKNPTAEDRDLTMDDYGRLGIMAALDAVRAIVPDRKIHATGYCLGGTLLSIATAAIARGDDEPFASLTLLASQVDFTEAGELQLFIDESQLAFLDSVMWKQGYLDSTQMAGAFQMLRSNDLIWSRGVREYMMGDRQPMIDLMAWNADGTRMPHAMHSEYLRKLYLENDLSEGRLDVDGRPVSLADIRLPIFAVGTQWDHVAPWPSVYKIHSLTNTEVTFALTSGGHNGGIVSQPGHPRRSYRVRTTAPEDLHLGPDAWMAAADKHDGSWWEAWTAWLDQRSGPLTAPPETGNAEAGYAVLADAPGGYVLER